MSSFSDDAEQDNDDVKDTDGEPTTVPAADQPAHRPPPVATDFTRITTRYMIAAREWTRATRYVALEALRRAVVPWSGVFWLTFWKWRGFYPFEGRADRPGLGSEHRTTIELYGKWLAAGSRGTYAKGQAVSTTMARSRYRGHSDDECTLRSGILMDSDDCGGWDAARALHRDVELSFVGQMRPIAPDRHHIEIPLWPPLVPVRDDSGVVNWKRNFYQPRLGWILGILSELIGLRYDPFWEDEKNANAKYAGYDPCCDQLTHLCHVYTRRPDDPEDHFPVTDWNVAGALDFSALIALTDFEAARAQLEHPPRRGDPGAKVTPFVARRNVRGLEEMEPRRVSTVELLVRLRRLRNPESQVLINRLLAGESYAPIGQRDNEMHRAAAIVAALAPNEDPEQLARLLFTRSLEVMAKMPGADPTVEPYIARAAKKIARAQQRLGGAGR